MVKHSLTPAKGSIMLPVYFARARKKTTVLGKELTFNDIPFACKTTYLEGDVILTVDVNCSAGAVYGANEVGGKSPQRLVLEESHS